MSEQQTNQVEGQANEQADEQIACVTEDCAKAPINPRWMLKLGVITVIIFIVGAWGYWDASSVYPNRGMRYASYAKYQYLEQAHNANAEDFGIFLRESSVTNPVEEFNRLKDPSSKSSRPLRASMMSARLAWFEALNVVGHLDEEHTTIESPQRELDSLKSEWQTAASIPKPLHAFDLIVQWMVMALCWTIALLMFVHILKSRSKKYSWKADSMTLSVPGNHAITPDDLEEVDKRKWDKFIVFLKIKDSHATLGGKEISVDTYQRQFVEEWILAMEEKAFGSQEDGDDADSSSD